MRGVTVPPHNEAFLRGVDAVNRGDDAAVFQFVDDDTVFEPLRSATEGAFVGVAGMRRFLADTAETFELFKVIYDDVRDLGDNRFLAIGTIRMRGRGSGFENDVPTAAIIEFRENGVMRHYHDYGDARRALQEADLPS
jgi:ketosteroid isomerase-like protein